jgi:hypothetical protein
MIRGANRTTYVCRQDFDHAGRFWVEINRKRQTWQVPARSDHAFVWWLHKQAIAWAEGASDGTLTPEQARGISKKLAEHKYFIKCGSKCAH